MSRFSFTRRPVWLIGHVIVIVAIVGFVMLGLWQLDRHTDRQNLDDTLTQRLTESPVPYEDLAGEAPDDMEYRRVTFAGVYDTDEEVILQARSLDGVSGHEVLTPLVGDAATIVVNRGWVPIDVSDPPVEGAEPPPGAVVATGYVRTTETRQGLGPVDPDEGVLDRISRVDITRLQEQTSHVLEPVYLVLSAQDPASGEFPRFVTPPQPGDGPPHLSYAIQWFAFAGVVLVGYPILLVRTAARRNQDRG